MAKYKPHLLGLILLLISVAILFLMKNASLFGDEIIHFKTINDFMNLNITQDIFLRDAKLPGYAALIGLLKRILNIDSIFDTRILNFFISSLCIYVFYLISKKIDPANARIKTLQFFFFPLIFVFFFLLYTDIFSLLLLLLSFYLILKDRSTTSGIPAVLSILVRQNNIIWVVFFLVLVIKKYKGSFIYIIKRTWIYFMGIFLFTVFVFINGGATIGEMNKRYQAISFHSENFYTFLLLSFFIFLPTIILNYKTILNLFLRKSALLIVISSFLIFIISFKGDHPWNNILFDYFIRNEILRIINRDLLTKFIFFIPMAISLIYLLSIKLHNNLKHWLYLFIIIFLISSWLVDPRYYITPFTFLLLLKQEKSKKTEFIIIILYMLLSFGIFFGTLNRYFFI